MSATISFLSIFRIRGIFMRFLRMKESNTQIASLVFCTFIILIILLKMKSSTQKLLIMKSSEQSLRLRTHLNGYVTILMFIIRKLILLLLFSKRFHYYLENVNIFHTTVCYKIFSCKHKLLKELSSVF